ncbi:hypothetical protein B296_00013891 [Ensete ventricosum]|uniref:ADP,ATP carrier protein n=1 Tax=Ensete ventricosum TaxID=4639 RepID=A0A427AXK6_ENSVE|nr:hypothetical protein B296_00013891 [Ensete ventricosum]
MAALARSEMQTEARIEVVTDGGSAQRSLLSAGSVLHRHEQHQPQIETVARLLSGGVAGAVSKTCTAPLARLTILLQVRPGCAFAFIFAPKLLYLHILLSFAILAGECWLFWMVSGGPSRKEGLRRTWVGSDFLQVIPWQLKVFLAAGIDLHADSEPNSWKLKGIFAKLDLFRISVELLKNNGCFHDLSIGPRENSSSSSVTFPLDLVRRRKQLEGAAGRSRVYTTGLFGTFGHILRTEGIRGLYRGILPEYYKVVPGVGIAFMTFETLKSCLSGSPNDER